MVDPTWVKKHHVSSPGDIYAMPVADPPTCPGGPGVLGKT